MKKQILTLIVCTLGLVSYAQVGIGTMNPQTTFHAVGANATDTGAAGANTPGILAATDGITVPVVTTNMTLVSPAVGFPVNGTKVGQLVYSNFATKEGFYYWDGSVWSKLGASAVTTFTGRTAQLSTAAYDWTNGGVGLVDFYEFTTGTGPITLPSPVTFAGKTIHVRNNTGTSISFGATDGVNRPRNVGSLVATGAMQIWSDGTNWHNVAGRQ